MALTFRGPPRVAKREEVDGRGQYRKVTATKHDSDFNWKLEYEQEDGFKNTGTYHGENVGMAMEEMLNRHNPDFRGNRARPIRDPNVIVNDAGEQTVAAPRAYAWGQLRGGR